MIQYTFFSTSPPRSEARPASHAELFLLSKNGSKLIYIFLAPLHSALTFTLASSMPARVFLSSTSSGWRFINTFFRQQSTLNDSWFLSSPFLPWTWIRAQKWFCSSLAHSTGSGQCIWQVPECSISIFLLWSWSHFPKRSLVFKFPSWTPPHTSKGFIPSEPNFSSVPSTNLSLILVPWS